MEGTRTALVLAFFLMLPALAISGPNERLPHSDGTANLRWWFDPVHGAVCWDGRRPFPNWWGDFVVDLDGDRRTGISSIFNRDPQRGNYTQHMTWDRQGGSTVGDETGTRESFMSERVVVPPYPHVRFSVGVRQSEWFHLFVTKRTPPTDWILGVSDDDGQRGLPILRPFWITVDFGKTWKVYDPATFTGPTGQCKEDLVSSPWDLKHEAIDRIKALKAQAMAKIDGEFLEELDEAEAHVWRSLGFTHPFRPVSITSKVAPDVTVGTSRGDDVTFVLGTSWKPRLGAYSQLRITWVNSAVTAIDLLPDWSENGLETRARPWVDAWHQDVRVDMRGEDSDGLVALDLDADQASLGFTISLDTSNVANLTFSYEMRPLWTDASHLDPKQGGKVFHEERKAITHLLCSGNSREDHNQEDGCHDDSRDGCADENLECGGDVQGRCGDDNACRVVHAGSDSEGKAVAEAHCRLDPERWNVTERTVLDRQCDLITNLLVKADQFLARVAVQLAKDTPIRDPARAGEVLHEIARAEKELARAMRLWDMHDYLRAINHFEDAWKNAQRAIEKANR